MSNACPYCSVVPITGTETPGWLADLLTEASAAAHGNPNADSLRRVILAVPEQYVMDAGLTWAIESSFDDDAPVIRRYGPNDFDAKRPQRRHVCFHCGLSILDGAEVTETSNGALAHTSCDPERYAREVLRREPPRVQ